MWPNALLMKAVCYLGQFDAASPVTVTERTVTKIFYKNGKTSKNNIFVQLYMYGVTLHKQYVIFANI